MLALVTGKETAEDVFSQFEGETIKSVKETAHQWKLFFPRILGDCFSPHLIKRIQD